MQLLCTWFFLFANFILCSSFNEINEFRQVLRDESNLLALFTEECCACTMCVEYETMLGAMSKTLEEMNLPVVKLKSSHLKVEYGIKATPAIVYIRDGKPALYDGKLEPEAIYWWVSDNSESYTKTLNDATFEHLTQAATGATTGEWLVVFYEDSCIDRNALYTHLESVASHLKARVNMAIVNSKNSPETMDRFKIKNCPEVILFRYGKMYRTVWGNSASLRRFAERLYKEHKAEPVPVPRTNFDKIVDYVAKSHFLNLIMATTLLVFVVIFACVRNAKEKEE